MEELSDFSSLATRREVWQAILGVLVVVISIGLIIGGQNNTSFSVFWAAPTVGLSGKTFTYTMWGGISKLLEEKSYGIAWTLILFSGLWPVVKLLFLLVVSLVPEGGLSCFPIPWLTSSRKYTIVSSLCQWGRLSFIDLWVVSLIVLTIRVNQESLPGLSIAFWVQAVGERGVGLFLAGILMSQALSNILVTLRHCQELSKNTQHFAVIRGDEDFEGAGKSGQNVWEEEEGEGNEAKLSFKEKFSLFQGMQIQWIVLTWVFLVLIALFVPCYQITYTAATQVFASPVYSLLTGFATIAGNSHPETLVGCPSPKVLSFFGVVLVVLLPLLQGVILLVLWFVPLPYAHHVTLHLWLDNISHFASCDSFVVSLIIVSAEIGDLLNRSELGSYVRIQMIPTGAFVVVALVAFGFSPLVRFVLLHHRVFLLDKGALARPLLQ
jgi:hypothetical protein